VLANPHFAAARARYFGLILAIYDNNPFLARLFGDSARYSVFLTALRLDALQVPDEPPTWLTQRSIGNAVGPAGILSPRTLTNCISRLCQTGYLTKHPAPQDRRRHLLKPTPKMLAFYTQSSLSLLHPLAMLVPRADYGAALSGDAGFMLAQRRAAAAVLDRSIAILARNPEVMLFFSRDAGFLVMAMLERSAAQGNGIAEKPYAEAARRFGISRTHVRKLLQAAEEAGLVEIRAAGGRAIALTDKLQRALDRFFADVISVTDLIFVLTTSRETSPAHPATSWPGGSTGRSSGEASWSG